MSEIQPAHVYEQVIQMRAEVAALRSLVWWLALLVGLLCALVVLQIVGKVLIFSRVIELLRRVGVLVGIVEAHGSSTDRRIKTETATAKQDIEAAKQDIIKALVSSATEIKTEVPPAVVEKLGESNSGTGLPVVRPDAERQREDNTRGYG